MITREKETLIGAIVVAGLALVLATSYGGSGRASVQGYDLTARFNKAEGIAVGSDVRLSGVSVGKVVGQSLDNRYRAVLAMRVNADVQLPDDSAALIQTDGLLGSKFIALQPGGSEANLKPGQEFAATQDSMNVRDLLEMIIDQANAKRASAQKKEGAAR